MLHQLHKGLFTLHTLTGSHMMCTTSRSVGVYIQIEAAIWHGLAWLGLIDPAFTYQTGFLIGKGYLLLIRQDFNWEGVSFTYQTGF